MPAEVAAPWFTAEVLTAGLALFGFFGALWVYYDRRDRTLYDTARRKVSFHCIRCDHVYAQRKGTETAPCPRCGHVNTRLKF